MDKRTTAMVWMGRWFLILSGITLAGGLAGGFLFPLVGSVIGMDLSVGAMVMNGLKDGAFLAFIWAPGLSFVACLMWANEGRPPFRGD